MIEAKQEGLSAREEDVARLLMRGVSNKEIARKLDIEVVTVKKHVGSICRKLGARNRTQAALCLAAAES
jgi:two-component system, NarL family, nitrate/nitrite response regulator NarL